MTTRQVFLLFILAVLLVAPAMGQITTAEKYQEELDKLKISSSYVTLNDKGEIEYSIIGYDPAYKYYIRVYSLGHSRILQEHLLKESSGVIPFNYPGFYPKVYLNLQKWIPDGKEREYCKEYPCKIGENLDIFTTGLTEKVSTTDLYTIALRRWTRNDPITGASWQAMTNVDKGIKS